MKNPISLSGSPRPRDKTLSFIYGNCALCPRKCRVDRRADTPGCIAGAARDPSSGGGPAIVRQSGPGFCGEGADIRAAAAVIHYGEEPPVTGAGGSGTVFFTGCTLKCAYCQNHQLSRGGAGRTLTDDELGAIFLSLQEAGAENINLVTGTHFIPGIVEALEQARAGGLVLPVVWNSSGFEAVEALELIDPYIDVYLPDLKTVSAADARTIYGTEQYAAAAKEAVLWMADRKPLASAGPRLRSGVIVRHLVLPGLLDVTRNVLEWYGANLKDRALVSVMFQYAPPADENKAAPPWAEAHRSVSREEYDRVMSRLDEFGIEEGFVQELEDDGQWSPDFNQARPFHSPESRTVWHWRAGEQKRACQ